MKCKNCKVEFEPKRAWQKFCSSLCRIANWSNEKVKQNA